MKKKGKSDYWNEAVRLSKEFALQKALGASHKKTRNIEKRMRYNIRKMFDSD